MNVLAKNLEALEAQVMTLIKVKKELAIELEKQRKESTALKLELETLQKETEELREKNKILRIAGGADPESNREVKLKINEIVREVDKCIAQLNQ